MRSWQSIAVALREIGLGAVLNAVERHETAVLVMTVVSAAVFVGTLIAVPIWTLRLPQDYFTRPLPQRPPAAVMARTVSAAVLILMGIAMLVLPGQGLLTILLGVSLLDFPAKRRLERRMLARPHLLQWINRLRARAHKPPVHPPAPSR